ncbi:MAG: RsmB/NOP family class I SAM-dependent RNA methyltransferase [Acetobacter sp.]|nr:RsmB/NOP family class I SAM-dependent RNA methyltransferase [Acetobacter sp.]
MTPSAQIAASIELLAAMEEAPRKPADAIAHHFFKERRYIGSSDRRNISTLVWHVLRHWYKLTWWLEKQSLTHQEHTQHTQQQGLKVIPRLLVGAWLLFDGLRLQEVITLYQEGRFSAGSLTQREINALVALEGQSLMSSAMSRAVALEVPEWLLPALEESFGPDTECELAALSVPAPLDVRVNILRKTREEACVALAREGIYAKKTVLSPWGLRLKERTLITSTTPFREGIIEIQDEGSQLVAAITGVTPGMRVLDYCAGAGGKTLAMAMMMHNKGHIVACDVSAPRLEGAVKRLRRAGVHNVERHLLLEGDKWAKRRLASFDCVLVDAPCSGIGTWRRNPDARVRLTRTDLEELVIQQATILERAAAFVRPGGRLVYATCSILQKENADQIKAFLKHHTGFKSVPSLSPFVPDILRQKEEMTLTPARHGTDGFFAVVMERLES